MEEALASFVRLSSALVGDDQLPEDLAAAYFEQARTALADERPAPLARFADLLQGDINPVTALRQPLLPDPRWGPPSEIILALWFNGRIQNAAGDWVVTSADGYYRALVWDVIGAHPPTLSSGYSGIENIRRSVGAWPHRADASPTRSDVQVCIDDFNMEVL